MKKRKDEQDRWRNKVIAFRMSPEEAEMLDKVAKLSGFSKQDYIISKLLDHSVVVQGNPRVYKALRDTMGDILSELSNLNGTSPSADLLATIEHITTVMDGLKGGGNE
ncbi:MAG: mobilization protein [Eubacteriales bacterium]